MKKLIVCLLALSLMILSSPRTGLSADKMKDTTLQLSYTPIDIDLPTCPVRIAVVKFTESKPIKKVRPKQAFQLPPVDGYRNMDGKSCLRPASS
ncbi:hypothetical protein [Maridesulfovibrio sp.]|uniref:hypothetical protein n=1 Tax=Maridesulfovibrio sp. TaxID=2795000 RepID=UPI0029C9EAC1|nr:hypothetical protein [Maridesulfovibrio sp.]